MNKIRCLAFMVGMLFPLVILLNACGENGTLPDAGKGDPQEPPFNAALFDVNSATINHDYLPFLPGKSWVYEGLNDEGVLERTEITVSHETRVVDGVQSAIVVERNYQDGELIEETFDWYAQDKLGNVWYMGEDSKDFENGEVVSTEGSWESGKDIDGVGENAVAGILIKSKFKIGDSYQQEFYKGIAEDMAEVIALNVPITLSSGESYSALQTREWNPLEPDSVDEYKFYASGVGLIMEKATDDSEKYELIATADQKAPVIDPANFINSSVVDNTYFPLAPKSVHTFSVETDEGTERTVVEVLPETKTVMGIEAAVVRDRVYLNDVLMEDTHDWFAQDNAGNVWYFGETVDNYTYDDMGGYTIDNEGSWEAGKNGAQPGIQMPALLRVGDSYRQEYLEGEAEDLAAIVEKDVVITLGDGSQFTTLKTKEWNPLEPGSGFEYKYYAPGVGLVREENEDGSEQNELIDIQMQQL